nr:aminoglycoside phosphotransferase family protein [Arthrobacter roseus]
MVVRYLPGEPVEGTPSESHPDTYRQAGELLRRIHRRVGASQDYFNALMVKTNGWLNRADELVSATQLSALRRLANSLVPRPVELVATHGDYQPRNWIQHDGEVRVIDFGRAAPRPWVHDVIRLSHQQLLGQPELANAFFEGYGTSIGEAERDIWVAENLNQAVGTVVWAHDVGDSVFEESGRSMVTRVLSSS